MECRERVNGQSLGMPTHRYLETEDLTQRLLDDSSLLEEKVLTNTPISQISKSNQTEMEIITLSEIR